MRNNILGINKKLHYRHRLFTSEMLSSTSQWLNSKYKEFYERKYCEENQNKKRHVGTEATESWSTGHVDRKRQKTSFYDNCFLFGNLISKLRFIDLFIFKLLS